MKIAGIIAEYNPFHSGHAYHVEETRHRTNCDAVIAVMGGHFTQRGEPACMDKWSRVQMALACGVDAVFELPTLFAVRTADAFAAGGVGILDGLGIDYISYGCENNGINLLDALTELSLHEPESVRRQIRQGLDEGKALARARGEAYARHLEIPAETLNAPNTVLALEYRKALRRLNSALQPVAIPRQGEYHDTALQSMASAGAIRNAIRSGDAARAAACVPASVRPLLKRAEAAAIPDALALYKLRSMRSAELAALPDAPEGIETRVQRAAAQCGNIESFLDAVKCKRYTRARITRLLAHALIGMDARLTNAHPTPEYARLLGMRKDADTVLRELSRRSRLPILSGCGKIKDHPVFQLECRATDLWALTRSDPAQRMAGQEFTHKFAREFTVNG